MEDNSALKTLPIVIPRESTLTVSSILQGAFTENCGCLDDFKFEYPPIYNDNNPSEYCEQASKKIDIYMEEVLKHTNPDPVEYKPCYKKQHTTGLVLLKSYKKHRRTLIALRQAVYELKEDHKVEFLNGRKIKVQDFLRMWEGNINNNISVVRVYRSARSKIETSALLASIRGHKATLKVLSDLLEHVNGVPENVVGQLD
jgi:hypothetical protein